MVRWLTWWERADYMHFAITSRAEMPNEELRGDLACDGGPLSYSLYFPGEGPFGLPQ